MEKKGNLLVQAEPTFDEFSADYETALQKGLSASGENRKYFAQARIEWLLKCLHELNSHPEKIMDFGCGTGSSFEFFLQWKQLKEATGVDVSEKSLEVARRTYKNTIANFLLIEQFSSRENLDLVYCNGVFHHIPPADRRKSVEYVVSTLKPGALFSFWENNPWNPGTRYIMNKIPFDREAITLSYLEAKAMLESAGLEIIRIDFAFIFPKSLSFLRWIEPLLHKLPLGAQYQILAKKPHTRED